MRVLRLPGYRRIAALLVHLCLTRGVVDGLGGRILKNRSSFVRAYPYNGPVATCDSLESFTRKLL